MGRKKTKVIKPLLEFVNVSVSKGGRRVLDSLDLRISVGENVAVLGPNGSGKSSLIKLITREFYPAGNSGRFVFQIMGQDVWNIFQLRSHLGVVSNELQFTCNRDISGQEIIQSGFYNSIGLGLERVTAAQGRKTRAIMRLLEIEGLKDRRMNEMSSGEARRFLIGRALAHEPKALVLDEPMNSLDIHAAFKFCAILSRIAQAGTSIIMVTHNVTDIIPEIKRVVLMKEGRCFLDGPKEDVLISPNLTELFNSRVSISSRNGYYYARQG